ncbi:hypothetical protein ACHQM5_021502 [Ranunculus cassubicifolius]
MIGLRARGRARVDHQTPFIAVDERNRRIAVGKFRLQMGMILQFCVQLLGVLYVREFKGFDDKRLIFAFGYLNIWCVNSIRVGLIGVWENDLRLIEGYFVSSKCATMFACGFVYNYCRDTESTRTWMGMNPSDLCAYLYILYGKNYHSPALGHTNL